MASNPQTEEVQPEEGDLFETMSGEAGVSPKPRMQAGGRPGRVGCQSRRGRPGWACRRVSQHALYSTWAFCLLLPTVTWKWIRPLSGEIQREMKSPRVERSDFVPTSPARWLDQGNKFIFSNHGHAVSRFQAPRLKESVLLLREGSFQPSRPLATFSVSVREAETVTLPRSNGGIGWEGQRRCQTWMSGRSRGLSLQAKEQLWLLAGGATPGAAGHCQPPLLYCIVFPPRR